MTYDYSLIYFKNLIKLLKSVNKIKNIYFIINKILQTHNYYQTKL